MKKLVVLSLGVFMLTAVSCTKDYTCTCETNSIGTITYDYDDQKEADAQANCDLWDGDGWSCTLAEK